VFYLLFSTPNTYLLDIIFQRSLTMTPEKIESERRRSRPMEKPKKMVLIKRNKLWVSVILIIIAIVIIAALAVIYTRPAKNRIAVIDTSMGTIRVELYEDKMPITTANFVKLANEGFYDNTIFHRIGANFMIQAGGYSSDGTPITSPYGNIQFESSDVKHVNGAISMASTAAQVGGSAQFFICDGAQTSLDGDYAAFGVTVEGLDVVHAIATQSHDNSNGDGTGVPINDIIIESITIVN
jgi:cyclophilin family peptidyl-prolyl cis-trans isomerase